MLRQLCCLTLRAVHQFVGWIPPREMAPLVARGKYIAIASDDIIYVVDTS